MKKLISRKTAYSVAPYLAVTAFCKIRPLFVRHNLMFMVVVVILVARNIKPITVTQPIAAGTHALIIANAHVQKTAVGNVDLRSYTKIKNY